MNVASPSVDASPLTQWRDAIVNDNTNEVLRFVNRMWLWFGDDAATRDDVPADAIAWRNPGPTAPVCQWTCRELGRLFQVRWVGRLTGTRRTLPLDGVRSPATVVDYAEMSFRRVDTLYGYYPVDTLWETPRTEHSRNGLYWYSNLPVGHPAQAYLIEAATAVLVHDSAEKAALADIGPYVDGDDDWWNRLTAHPLWPHDPSEGKPRPAAAVEFTFLPYHSLYIAF